MNFSDVIGQQEMATRLKQMVRENRLPHALLFCGPSGCGKMAMALALASYLLCDSHDEEPCGICRKCKMLAKWQHPDLHFYYPVIRPQGTSSDHKMASSDFAAEWRTMLFDGPYFTLSHWMQAMNAANQQAQIGVGDSVELLHDMSFKANQGGYKICIIWLPERMNGECANKILKVLEEPPEQSLFIMVTEHPEQIIETILSRTQRIDFKPLSTDLIAQTLVDKRGVDEQMARLIARSAGGNWTAALEQLTTSSENREFFDMFVLLMRLAYMRDIKELKKWSEAVVPYGREKQKRMLLYFLRMVRENFMYNFGNPDLVYMSREEEAFAVKFARFINEANVIEMTELFNRALRDIGQNTTAKIVFFDLAVKVIIALLRK